jgi:hypothetical protein
MYDIPRIFSGYLVNGCASWGPKLKSGDLTITKLPPGSYYRYFDGVDYHPDGSLVMVRLPNFYLGSAYMCVYLL